MCLILNNPIYYLEAIVVGKGLEKIQEAFGIHMQGVSAKKIVVSLWSEA